MLKAFHCYHSNPKIVFVVNLQHTLIVRQMYTRYISHEIRTPLNTVYMGLGLAAKELGTKNIESAMSTITDSQISCDIALDVLNDLLLYDKLENGIMRLDITAHDPVACMSKAVAPFQLQVW